MSLYRDRQMAKLEGMLDGLSSAVGGAVREAIRAAERRDPVAAQEIINGDPRIDRRATVLEEEVLHTLACYQPVAFDLRYTVSVLKMANDLERIGDQAVNIAELAKLSAEVPPIDGLAFIAGMTDQVETMLRDALEAMLETDLDKARRVRRADDRVDMIHRRMYERVETAMRERPDNAKQLIQLVSISRQLERIGDLTVNIAEDVIYLVTGEIFRHKEAVRS